MKTKARWIVGSVIGLAAILLIASLLSIESVPWGDLLLWTVLCMLSELFWLKTPSGDSVQTLAATAKLLLQIAENVTQTAAARAALLATAALRGNHVPQQIVEPALLGRLVLRRLRGGLSTGPEVAQQVFQAAAGLVGQAARGLASLLPLQQTTEQVAETAAAGGGLALGASGYEGFEETLCIEHGPSPFISVTPGVTGNSR